MTLAVKLRKERNIILNLLLIECVISVSTLMSLKWFPHQNGNQIFKTKTKTTKKKETIGEFEH